jgi:putative hemolysin
MDKTILNVVVIFILLVANGIFAMSEIALISAKKVRLKQKADNGDASAKTALELAENPNRFLSTTQIGITLIGILAGALGGATLSTELGAFISKVEVLVPYSEGIAFTIVVLLTTYFSLVIGELIPKRLAMGNPEKIAAAVAIPMQGLSKITAPIVHY